MEWSRVVECVSHPGVSGRHDIAVRGVQYDSRRVSAGDVFVAMRGGVSDGNAFIDAAIRQGAVAIVTDSAETFAELKERQPELAVALVEHGRRALAEVSSAVFGAPEKQLKVCAVTGTNGKTTTAYLLEQMLMSVGRKVLLVGTIETRMAGVARPSEHTTPESRDLMALFAEALRAGCTEVVMEMSSHALEQERVWGIPVDVAIFTNLTQDHLDYHGTMEAYAAAKARLFEGVGAPPPRVAVIERSGEYAGQMMEAARGCSKVIAYERGVSSEGVLAPAQELWAADQIDYRRDGTTFALVQPRVAERVHSPLTGDVNVLNLLAAMAAARERGLSMEEVLAAVKTLRPAPGRFESVPNELGITVVVDYAHTADALRNLLMIAHDFVNGKGRVITMFGCGGDRDKTKRPKMGREATANSDFVVITSDNPRSEGPMEIIEQVMTGVREQLGMFAGQFVVEPDRRAAIEVAVRAARPGDIVLLAGKGHEKTQTFADGAVAFDDVAEAERVLRTLKDEVSA